MEIEKSYYNKVKSFIENANQKKEIELEVRFWDENYEKIEINEEKFKKIFEYYTFSKVNDGLECKYEMSSSLDVNVHMEGNNSNSNITRTRLSINDSNHIKKYWLQNNLTDIPYKIIEKKHLERLDIKEYYLRVSLNDEVAEENIFEKNKNQLLNEVNNVNNVNNKNSKLSKMFRLKNRYNIMSEDGLFLIDLTTLKSGIGKTFRDANVLKAFPTYEIEIEYIGNKDESLKNKHSSDDVVKSLFNHLHNILSIMNDSDFILKQSIKSAIMNSFTSLVNTKTLNNDKGGSLLANPVTLHRSNIIKSSNTMNILNRYSVSLKADGMRHIAYVLPSQKAELNGNIYLIDINNNIVDTGLKDEKYINSVIEGEYVKLSSSGAYEFFAYDMLFDRGNDIRNKQYYNTYKEERLYSRSKYLELFINSSGRKERLSNVVKINRKAFSVSVNPDGTDIIEKANAMWKSRESQPFFVDGMIFTPMYDHYPLKGGSWYALFKWKPPKLNTIDFLIEVVKNDYGSEMKFPHLEPQLNQDGTINNILKQYKKIRLYVGTLKDSFDEKSHKMTKKKYKTLFNPYDLDETGAEAYNTCYVFIDENDKIICEDPITGEKDVVNDDTIIEFGFDSTREKGFQWVPYRVRYDKTTSYKNNRFVFGNFDKIANDIFRSLQYPVTEEMVTVIGKVPLDDTGAGAINAPYYASLKDGNIENNASRLPYQNFHNHHIKLSLFKQVNPSIMAGSSMMGGKLLDLCCGKGVDMKKIKPALYAEVVGIDIDYDNIKFAQQFYDRAIPKPKPKAYFVRGDAGKLIFPNQDCAFDESGKIQLRKFIQTKYYFDVVNIQFALHYFFENEIRLRSLLQNANDNLKIGGYFIGTSFDGERVHQLLKGVNEVEGKTFGGETLWKIQKKYSTTRMSFDSTKPNFGKQIDVLVKSIGNVHSEYLVNYNYLDAILEEYGFVKVMVKPFSQYHEDLLKGQYENKENTNGELDRNIDNAKRMSAEEQKFSFLNNAFVYKKVSNTSDTLFKKLVKMIEDQVKKEKRKNIHDEDVEILDNETAHLVINVEKNEETNDSIVSNTTTENSNSEVSNTTTENSNSLVSNTITENSNSLVSNTITENSNSLVSNTTTENSNSLVSNTITENSNSFVSENDIIENVVDLNNKEQKEEIISGGRKKVIKKSKKDLVKKIKK